MAASRYLFHQSLMLAKREKKDSEKLLKFVHPNEDQQSWWDQVFAKPSFKGKANDGEGDFCKEVVEKKAVKKESAIKKDAAENEKESEGW